MCGRYTVVATIEEIEKRFNLQHQATHGFNIREGQFANYNLGAGMEAPIVASDAPGILQPGYFGFAAKYGAVIGKRTYLLNARAEGDHNQENAENYSGAKGIITKSSFRSAIRSQRCLVVCTGFYEGPEKEKLSKPYLFYMTDPEQRIFALAGIWNNWIEPATGEVIKTFAIITTVTNKYTKAVGHHRSPVILQERNWSQWLNPQSPLADATSVLEPYNGDGLNVYPVSAAMKSPRAVGPQLIEPVGPPLFAEKELRIKYERKLSAKERRDLDDTRPKWSDSFKKPEE